MPTRGELVRHVCVHISDETLWLFFSCIGAKPEVIHLAEIPLTDDWRSWKPKRITTILTPQQHWEGAELRSTQSTMGPSKGLAAAVQDPFVFEDGGDTHMLYVGGAEFGGIGLCSLHPTSLSVDLPTGQPKPSQLAQVTARETLNGRAAVVPNHVIC